MVGRRRRGRRCVRSGGVGTGSWGVVFGGGVFLPEGGGWGVSVCWFLGVLVGEGE